ncbi:arginyltransferase [Pseudomonas sp. F1_0610]|uniref:arginyltransferase n=1 Tax=Pseudomonas sp. F1_0610 TaxID=3114284 RepID=UPI0039C36FAE
MTIKNNIDELSFFLSQSHDCSYFPDRQAKSLFTSDSTPLTTEQYSKLNALGFRRSGDYVYRPHCESCNECTPARVPVHKFEFSRTQKRTFKHNQDLQSKLVPIQFEQEHYQLYERYINARHADGSMFPATPEQYQDFILYPYPFAHLVEFRLKQRLIAIALIDILVDGLSAVYSFFDPKEEKRSLGSFIILWQIEEAKRRKLSYVYLGYWLKNCQKMSYKAKYRPIELRYFDNWRQVKLID